MSLFKSVTLTCPACGEAMAFDAAYSVNADRRPDLREAIVEGTFQRHSCPACEATFRLDPEMTYLDVAQGQWIVVHPARALGDWEQYEGEAVSSFSTSYGEKASPAAKAIGDDLDARVAFGWSALREKLLIAEAGLNDADLELVKIAMLRGLDNMPLGEDTELRLVAVEDDELVMAWVRVDGETVVETLRVPRDLYDEIAADKKGWQPLREAVTQGPFVDMQRLMVGEA